MGCSGRVERVTDEEENAFFRAASGRKPPSIRGVKETLGDCYTKEIEWAWPDVAPSIFPCGNRILVQLRTPARVSRGGIVMPDESKTMEQARAQTAMVRALGPVAFRNRTTLEEWPEGAWCGPGSFIRTPMYGGDRFQVPIPNRDADDFALFVVFHDLDCLGIVLGDPLNIKTS